MATSNIGPKQTSLSIQDHDKQVEWYSKCSSHKYHSKTWHFNVNFKYGHNPDTVLKKHVSEQLINKKIKTAKHETAESVHLEQFQQRCALQQLGVLKKICVQERVKSII
jgi:hypothetical protein